MGTLPHSSYGGHGDRSLPCRIHRVAGLLVILSFACAAFAQQRVGIEPLTVDLAPKDSGTLPSLCLDRDLRAPHTGDIYSRLLGNDPMDIAVRIGDEGPVSFEQAVREGSLSVTGHDEQDAAVERQDKRTLPAGRMRVNNLTDQRALVRVRRFTPIGTSSHQPLGYDAGLLAGLSQQDLWKRQDEIANETTTAKDDAEVLSLFVEYGARAALREAIIAEDIDEVAKLLAAGVDPDLTSNDGSTALHMAVRTGNVEILELLLEHVADLDIPRKDGKTPLHLAALAGDVEIVQRLLDSGAAIQRETPEGRTARGLASDRFNHPVVSLLDERLRMIDPPRKSWRPLNLDLGMRQDNRHINGIDLSLLSNIGDDDIPWHVVNGIELSPLLSAKRKVSGLGIAALGLSVDRMNGLGLAGIGLVGERDLNGAFVGGLAARSEKGDANGLMVGGLLADVACGDFNGLMLGGLSAGVGDKADGNSTTRGVQLALLSNRSARLTGLQVGLFNDARHLDNGVQIGLLNFTDSDFLPFFPLINFRFGESSRTEHEEP